MSKLNWYFQYQQFLFNSKCIPKYSQTQDVSSQLRVGVISISTCCSPRHWWLLHSDQAWQKELWMQISAGPGENPLTVHSGLLCMHPCPFPAGNRFFFSLHQFLIPKTWEGLKISIIIQYSIIFLSDSVDFTSYFFTLFYQSTCHNAIYQIFYHARNIK